MKLKFPVPMFRGFGSRDRNLKEPQDDFNLGLLNTLGQLNISYTQISSQSIVEFIRNLDDKDFFPTGSKGSFKFPTGMKNTVATVDEVRALLNLILQLSSTEDIDLDNVPLLLTQDGYLRKFQKGNTIFCSRWCKLLPGQTQLVITNFIQEEKNSQCISTKIVH